MSWDYFVNCMYWFVVVRNQYFVVLLEKVLLASGSAADTGNTYGETALLWAALEGPIETVVVRQQMEIYSKNNHGHILESFLP